MAVPQHLLTRAQEVFNTIMDQCETSPFNTPPGQSPGKSYKPLTLLKCAYEQVEFKDQFLGYMFRSIHDLEGLTSPQGPDFDIARVLEEYHPEFNNYEETLSKIGENFYKTLVITCKLGIFLALGDLFWVLATPESLLHWRWTRPSIYLPSYCASVSLFAYGFILGVDENTKLR